VAFLASRQFESVIAKDFPLIRWLSLVKGKIIRDHHREGRQRAGIAGSTGLWGTALIGRAQTVIMVAGQSGSDSADGAGN
jgi:hypothetical protein